jgi:hypothetical protein
MSEIKTEYKYIKFVTDNRADENNKWDCLNRKRGDWLGCVFWDSQWRQFTFQANQCAYWSASCLADVQHFMGQLEKPK